VLNLSKQERTLQIMNDFSNPDFSSNRFSILTLRQAQGERIEKQAFSRLRIGRTKTDWKGALRQTSLDNLRTAQGEWMKKKPSQTLKAVSKIKNALRTSF
jgi:hypothetical protein